MKNLEIHSIELPNLEQILADCPGQGRVAQSAANLVYLKVDDNYIHNMAPMMTSLQAQRPSYFDYDMDFIGAHVSIIYPEEEVFSNKEELGVLHYFTIEGLFWAQILNCRYFALKIKAPSLLAMRHRYGLKEKLMIKNHLVDFHLTVGVQELL